MLQTMRGADTSIITNKMYLPADEAQTRRLRAANFPADS